jgi:hypothetical protein
MLVHLTRSELPSGAWYLRVRGGKDVHLVALSPTLASRVSHDSAWFSAIQEGAGWRPIRFVAGLIVDNPEVAPRARERSAQRVLEKM